MSSNLCIIPARGGSKRIPRKNVRNFSGKPIISYSIQAALNSGLFKEVMVSTEDRIIADIALQYGASVPFYRSEENADDYATTLEVIEEVIEKYQVEGKEFDNICCIYPTAPFVSANKLKEAFRLLKDQKYDVVVPVVAFSFPIQRSLKLKNGKLSYCFPTYENSRSQDLEKIYHDSGQFYFLNTGRLKVNNSMIPANSGAVIISEFEAQDIDTESDWKLAELKYELLQST